jgi:LysR family carnitine catabolism transcriptional activator
MDLRQFEYFVAVVDHQGFTAGARAVHVAQPSLSQAIRALERELGVRLFERVGRTVRLSAAGEVLLDPARQALRDAATVRAAALAIQGLSGGRLDLVALPTLAVEPLARLIGAFRRAHPGVSVRLVEPEVADEVAARVADGRCEVGLTEVPVAGSLLVERARVDQELLAVCPPGTVIGSRGKLPVSALASVPLVTTPAGTSTRRLLDEALKDADVVALIAVETANREAILPLVLAGAGVSFLPSPLARGAAVQGAVVLALDPPVRRRVGLVHRPGPLSPAANAFVDLAVADLHLPERTPPQHRDRPKRR